MDVKVTIDDKQIQRFFKGSPKRAKWAMKESLSKAGGHFGTSERAGNSLKTWIKNQEAGLAKLHPVTLKGRKGGKSPLYNIAKWVSFKYGMIKGLQTVRIGFLGKGQPAIIRKLFYGKRFRATPKIRALFHHRGVHLRKKTKMLEVPARQALDAFWRSKARLTHKYIEDNFFLKFFQKGQGPQA